MTILIKSDNLIKFFHDGSNNKLLVLNKINLEITKGEKVAILGASGSGKSTLLHILAGLDNPSSGKVFLDKYDLSELSDNNKAEVRNKYLGFVYQFHHLLPEFTALENIAMPLLIRGEDFDNALKTAATYLKKVELPDRGEHKPAQLSGGERQRVAIARALITKPKCILADEPTGNLDSDNARNIFNLFLDLNTQARTSIILVTHDENIAEQMDIVYRLENGVLIQQ